MLRVNQWFNRSKEIDAATPLINDRADVLFQNADSSAVLQTATKMGRRAFGWDSDMTVYGLKARLASCVINWGPYDIKSGDGSFAIWKRLILDNTGKDLVAKDAVADDMFMGGLKTCVKGVEAKVSGTNQHCRFCQTACGQLFYF